MSRIETVGLYGFVATLFFCLGFFMSSEVAEAALIYIDPDSAEIHRGDTETVAVRIDTDADECINVVDLILHYDPAIRAVDVSRGNSILNIWVEDPVINEEAHTITFAGGLPGGYCGRIPGDPRLTNILAEVVFRLPGFTVGSNNSTEAKVWIDEHSQVLLSDGVGSEATLRTKGSTFTLLPTAGTSQEDDWSARISDDGVPPADFAITLTKDDAAFDSRYFITFNSQDKQTGIDHYEVMEEPLENLDLFLWGRADAPWIVAESPYVLKDQGLNSTIRVKAIDKAGNETISILVPEESLRTTSVGTLLTFALIVAGVVVVLFCAGYLLWRRKEQIIDEYHHVDTSQEV